MIHKVWSTRIGGENTSDEDIRKLADNADVDRLAAWLSQIEEIRGSLAVNINKKIAADALLVRMAAG